MAVSPLNAALSIGKCAGFVVTQVKDLHYGLLSMEPLNNTLYPINLF